MSDLGTEPEIERELLVLFAGILLLFRNRLRRLAGAEVNKIWAAMAPLRESEEDGPRGRLGKGSGELAEEGKERDRREHACPAGWRGG